MFDQGLVLEVLFFWTDPERNVMSIEPSRPSRTRIATDSETDGTLSLGELDEVFAEATGTTPEKIERGAEAIDIESPENAEVVSE